MATKYTITRKIEGISRVFQRGKTQIPSCVRTALQIKEKDKILWILEEGKWVVEKA